MSIHPQSRFTRSNLARLDGQAKIDPEIDCVRARRGRLWLDGSTRGVNVAWRFTGEDSPPTFSSFRSKREGENGGGGNRCTTPFAVLATFFFSACTSLSSIVRESESFFALRFTPFALSWIKSDLEESGEERALFEVAHVDGSSGFRTEKLNPPLQGIEKVRK